MHKIEYTEEYIKTYVHVDLTKLSDEFYQRFIKQINWYGFKNNPTITTEIAQRFQHHLKSLRWYKDGRLHRTDGPAVIRKTGTVEWYYNGYLHRDNGPATIRPYGNEEWYKHGERHNEYGPAIIWTGGGEEWYLDGDLHRVNGPAITYPDGRQEWYEKGMYIKSNY